MKVIRKTMYPMSREVGPPITMVIRETDLKPGITVQDACDGDPVELFVLNDVFEVEDNLFNRNEEGIVKITLEAHQRQLKEQDQEWDMALLFYWTAMHFERLSEFGIITGTKPAPLTADQVEYSTKRLFKHGGYRHQTMITYSSDGFMVSGKDGVVTRTRADI